MEFYTRRTRYEEQRSLPGKRHGFKDYRDYYELQIRHELEEHGNAYSNYSLEASWYMEKRPYFNIWPPVVSMASSLKLDIPWSSVRIGSLSLVNGLLLRFPVQGDVPHSLRTVLFAIVPMEQKSKEDSGVGYLAFSDIGERDYIQKQEFSIYRTTTLQWYGDKSSTIEKSLNDRREANVYSPFEDYLARVLVCVSILSCDPDFISPDLLAKDRLAAEAPNATKEEIERLINRARKKGKVGWNIGKNIECSPHFRRPHFALRWTEKGHSVPKVVPVKGAIIKRSAMTAIPTGYLDRDDQ